MLDNSNSPGTVETVNEMHKVFDVSWFRDKVAAYAVKHGYIVQFLIEDLKFRSLDLSIASYSDMYEKLNDMGIGYQQLRSSGALRKYVIANNRNHVTYLVCRGFLNNREQEDISVEFKFWYILDLLKEDNYMQLFRLLHVPMFSPDQAHGNCLEMHKMYHSCDVSKSDNDTLRIIVSASLAYKNKELLKLSQICERIKSTNITLQPVIPRTIRKMISILTEREHERFRKMMEL